MVNLPLLEKTFVMSNVFFSRQRVWSLIWIVSEGQTIVLNIQFKQCIMSQFLIKLMACWQKQILANAYFYSMYVYIDEIVKFWVSKRKKLVGKHIYCIWKEKLHQSCEWMEFYQNCVERQSWKHYEWVCLCWRTHIQKKKHHTACI